MELCCVPSCRRSGGHCPPSVLCCDLAALLRAESKAVQVLLSMPQNTYAGKADDKT